jgi:3-dehydroquinate synthase
MDAIRIEVTSERGTYLVIIGAGLASQLPALLKERSLDAQTLIVTCPPVWRVHRRRLRNVLGKHTPVVLPDGERAKTLTTVGKIYDAMLKRRLDRSALILAFGGGVVGDTTGFAAATYLRGVRLIQVPTTLLAQVDSAIGGKVGVNLAAGKNLVGAFHPPSLVVCDPLLLATLPRREFRAGLYEVVKYGVIASRPLFDSVSTNLNKVFAHDPALATSIVSDCCRIKADVVMSDEREAGPRRVLNFGHTVGHALEAVTRYRRFLHGEAVACGMLAAAQISATRGLFPADDHAQLRDLIARMGPLPAVADLRTGDLIAAIEHDKKVVNGQLHFVATSGIGSTVIVSDVQTREIKDALRAIGLRR